MATHRAVADSLPLQIGQTITIAVQAITSLLLLRALGPGALGLYAVSAALAAALSFLDLSGANRLAVTELARASGASAPERTCAILGRFVRSGVLVRLPLVTAFVLLAPGAADWLYGRPDAGRWARWLCLPLAIDLPFDLLVVVLQGRGRIHQLARVETGRALLIALSTIAVLLAGLGLGGVVAVQVGVSAAVAVWAARAYRMRAAGDRTLPPWREVIRLATRAEQPPASAGFAMAIEKNLGNLAGQLPMLMIGALRPDAAGYFAAAVRTMSLPYPLVSAFARYLDVLLPQRAGESAAAARQAFVKVTLVAGGLWAIVTTSMILVAPVVLVRLAGEAYRPAIPALYPLVLQSLATGAGVGIGAAIRGLERPSHLIALQALSIAVTLPVGYALIPGLGAVGASWFHALRYAVLTAVGIGWVWWLSRPGAVTTQAAVSRSTRAPRESAARGGPR
jgi:O-antigen/teichoic acid export membrane protein